VVGFGISDLCFKRVGLLVMVCSMQEGCEFGLILKRIIILINSTAKLFCLFVYFCGARGSIVWLRHYATSQKVAGLSSDEVDFFQFT
jgi:hypothetical protein